VILKETPAMPVYLHRRSPYAPLWLALSALLLPRPALADPAVATPAGAIPAPPTTPQQKSLLVQMQDAFTGIAQTVEPSVVNIKSERVRAADEADGGTDGTVPPRRGRPGLPFGPGGSGRSEATGSGVIVRPDGYILTNDHVVEGASGGVVTVTLADGREFTGKVFPDFRSDLAVVKIDPGPTPLPAAAFAPSDSVRSGQWAIAVGSPFDLQNTVTVGIISALGRHQSIGGESAARYYPDLIQTDAAINPGNSGGPLFNIDGKVVGINVAIESPVEGSAGVGFAIPSDVAQQVMASLIQTGRVSRGYFGVSPEDLSPALQAQYGQKTGAFLRDIALDSPAGKAGLQAADIVTAFDGRPVRGEVGLREMIGASPPGKSVAIAYVRDGMPGLATVTLTAPPPDKMADAAPAAAPAPAGAPDLGLTVRDLLARDRLRLGLPPATSGVLVTASSPGGKAEAAAEAAGISLVPPEDRLGAVIQKIGGRPVSSVAEYKRAVAALPRGSGTSLIVLSTAGNAPHQTVLTLRP